MKSAGQGNASKGFKAGRWSIVEVLAFLAFLFWSGFGLYFTSNHITAATIAHWDLPASLKHFVEGCLEHGDPILILLAFTNTHLHAARQWTDGVARRWGLIVLLAAYGIEALGAHTGIPFGDYHYTTLFGPMLYGVPLTIPLAWHVVVTNSLFVVRALVPHVSHLTEAAATGLLCTLYDFILEPFATTVKHYWIWADKSIPPINYASWFVLSALLVGLFAPTVSTRSRFDPRPLLILALTVAIFIAGQTK